MLKKFGLSRRALTVFYRYIIESILSSCITACYGNSTATDRKALQRVIRAVEFTIGCTLPALQDTYHTRCRRKAKMIIRNPVLPASITQMQTVVRDFCPMFIQETTGNLFDRRLVCLIRIATRSKHLQ